MAVSGWTPRAPSSLARLVFFSAISVLLMIADQRGGYVERLRSGLGVALYPLQYIAAMPVRASGAVVDFIRGDRGLRERYEQLAAAQPLLAARAQKLESLEAENRHLRDLLGSAALVADRALVAELLEVGQEPFTHRITIMRGSRDGVYIGQPVIDANGVIGQVGEVGVGTSRAILITDPSHALPVQVVRNGLRAIVFGTGSPDALSVRYLTGSSDIQTGDVLVSSGIGGGFPGGYPVAQITAIVNNPNESFLDVIARPLAKLGHYKEVLLIWPGNRNAFLPAPAPAPQP
jgi:rod shape-determining protein MreC